MFLNNVTEDEKEKC